jgi:2-polyprenyl-3-methyl-5-hydroxy-6-metoxy-1,4-benzoquinol methylase
LNATLPPYDQVSYKETNEYAARIRLSILQVYYLFLNYLNIAIKNLYLRQFIPSLKAGVFLHPDHKNLSLYVNDRWEFSEAQKDLVGTQSLIEIGCGEGKFLKKIHNIVPCIIGIEYNEHAIKTARDNGFTIYTSDEYIEKKFDAIIAFHVLEHMANPINFIQSLSNMINDHGKIYLSVPNQDGPIQFIEPCIHNMPPHHATRWHAKTFKVLADRLHLSIEKIEFEPLAITDHYYYTHYWINSKITGKSYIHNIFKLFLNKMTSGIFELLKQLHVQRFKWLKGQSIYVILKRGN